MRKSLILFFLLTIVLGGCTRTEQPQPSTTDSKPADSSPTGTGTAGPLLDPQESHLKNAKQLTFGGQNAEAYWSSDGRQLIFQSTHGEHKCDQIFTMNVDGSNQKLVSTSKGRTTCSYFFPDGKKILFSSTHASSPECPAPPDMSKGYVWQINKDYDIYTANPDGSDLKQLTKTPGYDAEATISPDGKQIIFTSTRNGDLDIYVMNADGTNVRQLTNSPGYDGGAFFSPDGKQIVYRAFHPDTEAEAQDYVDLLKQGLIRPSKLEIFVMDADGGNQHQVTLTGKASFGPYFHPNGRQIIFSSNHEDPKGREFDLYLINTDGTGLERITYSLQFDGFPMFSPDGKRLVWASNRNGKVPHETNIFVAEWVD